MRRIDAYLDVFGRQNGGHDEQQEKKWGPGVHGFFFICLYCRKTECAATAASLPRPSRRLTTMAISASSAGAWPTKMPCVRGRRCSGLSGRKLHPPWPAQSNKTRAKTGTRTPLLEDHASILRQMSRGVAKECPERKGGDCSPPFGYVELFRPEPRHFVGASRRAREPC